MMGTSPMLSLMEKVDLGLNKGIVIIILQTPLGLTKDKVVSLHYLRLYAPSVKGIIMVSA